MTDETVVSQSQAQKKFQDVMKVDSPQKGTPDEYMGQWLQTLKDAGVARLEWKSYFSDDQVYFDDYDLFDAEDEYISEFPYKVINGDGLDGYLEQLQDMLYAVDTSGHYLLDVASGAVTRIEDIYESSERVEDPVEHVQYIYNVETKTWDGPIYPEYEDENVPYYTQIKLAPTEKRGYRNQISVADPAIGETDRWESIDGSQRYMMGAIKDALDLRNDGNYDSPRHKFSTRVVDRLGNIVFIASLMGVDWDSRAPFSVRWFKKSDPEHPVIIATALDSFEVANTELAECKEKLKTDEIEDWTAQILDKDGNSIKNLYSGDTRSTTFTAIKEHLSNHRMYEVEVAQGKEFLASKGILAEVTPEDLYSFADHIKALADWTSTIKFGLKTFGTTAVEFEVDAHAEGDDQGGSYWSIDDFVARDKDGVTLSRLSTEKLIEQMISSGELEDIITERQVKLMEYLKKAETDTNDRHYQNMINYYSEPLFQGETSLDNEYFVNWAEQHFDDQWNDDLSGNVSFNPDMYVYRVDQQPLYKGKFNNARYFVWTPEMTDDEAKAKQDYAVAYIRELAAVKPVTAQIEQDDDGENIDVSDELPF